MLQLSLRCATRVLPQQLASSSIACCRALQGSATLHHCCGLGRAPRRSGQRAMSVSAAAATDTASGTTRPHDATPNKPGSELQGLAETAWGQDKLRPTYPQLTSDVKADVVVIGAGFAGLCTAYNLVRAGKKVAVVESRTLAAGQSGRVAGSLQSWIDDSYATIEKHHGKDRAAQVAQAHQAAISWVEQVVADEGLECSLEQVEGYVYPAKAGPEGMEPLRKELDACQRLGLPNVKQMRLEDLNGPQDVLQMPKSVHLHPIKFLQGLAAAIKNRGGEIFELSHVEQFSGGSVHARCGGRATGDHVVYATQTPIHHNLTVHARQQPFRFYAVTMTIPQGSMDPKREFWSTLPDGSAVTARVIKHEEAKEATWPTGCLATLDGNDLLLLVNQRQRTGKKPDQQDDYWSILGGHGKARFPAAQRVAHKWAGQLYQPVDYLYFAGKDPLNDFQGSSTHWTATGDSGQHEVAGVIASQIIADGICGRENKFADVFSASRVPPDFSTLQESITGYMKTNVQAIGEVLLPKLKSLDDIAPDDGAVVTHNLKQVAVYKDENGGVHAHSAICPHLGCCVQWNPLTKTFDCPCHGSQYTQYGRVVNAPAKTDLSPIDW